MSTVTKILRWLPSAFPISYFPWKRAMHYRIVKRAFLEIPIHMVLSFSALLSVEGVVERIARFGFEKKKVVAQIEISVSDGYGYLR